MLRSDCQFLENVSEMPSCGRQYHDCKIRTQLFSNVPEKSTRMDRNKAPQKHLSTPSTVPQCVSVFALLLIRLAKIRKMFVSMILVSSSSCIITYARATIFNRLQIYSEY